MFFYWQIESIGIIEILMTGGFSFLLFFVLVVLVIVSLCVFVSLYVSVCMCFPSLNFDNVRISVTCVFVDTANFLRLEFFYYYFLQVCVVDRYCLNLARL